MHRDAPDAMFRAAQRGDADARARLVERYLPLSRSLTPDTADDVRPEVLR